MNIATLKMVLNLSNDKTVTLSLPNPKAGLTRTEVMNALNDIVAKQALTVKVQSRRASRIFTSRISIKKTSRNRTREISRRTKEICPLSFQEAFRWKASFFMRFSSAVYLEDADV